MATKYQVFVSSTYEDLKDERDQVIRAVLEMGHIPVGMEMFSAADEQQWKIISRHIDESDYYAVIVAHRYGSMVDGISYTRKEYEYAASKGIPVLGFLIEESAAWPADRVDKGADVEVLLGDFKSLVKGKPVSSWTSASDLYGKFVVALMKAITANPREGWVRPSGAVGPEVTAEISRLSAENARLRTQVDETLRETEADREAELIKTHSHLMATSRSLSYRYKTGDHKWQKADAVSNSGLFGMLAPSLLIENSLKHIAEFLAHNLGTDKSRNTDIVALNEMQGLLADWMVFDLVMPSERKHSLKDSGEYWSLTEFGKDLHKMQRRRRLMNEVDDPAGTEDPKKVTAKKVTAKKVR